MPPIIFLPQDISTPGKEFLLARGYELRLASAMDEATLAREVVGCEGILLRNARITRRVMEAAAQLKVVGRHGVGLDNVDLKAANELGIWVTNAPFSNTGTVAEHTLGMMIALARQMVKHDRELRLGNFEIRNQAVGVDLEGKTLGILGLGRIGSLVARKAALGLGMKVIAYSRRPKAVDDWVEPVERREELFRCSDFVSLHLPATPETTSSVAARELAWMKPTAFLLNSGRGEVVDENALVEALSRHRIAGAGLDVFETEPPASDHPFFALENVIVTPHSAALTVEAMERMGLHAAQGIHDVLSGRHPQWPVNHPATPRQPLT